MSRLSAEQQASVDQDGNVLLTACPGSGKTRVLAARVVRALDELTSPKHRVVAMTYTNRAADEIVARLDQESIDRSRLWAGTIHAFVLEWVLRPYAPYCPAVRSGVTVADEFYTSRILNELKAGYGKSPFLDVRVSRDRNGDVQNYDPVARQIYQEYAQRLRDERLVDYDDLLFFAYKLLADNEEIAATIGSIVRHFCVDEIQDTQDLQYAILSCIYQASASRPAMFFVGDPDQCIYESLGALPLQPESIARQFGPEPLHQLNLTGNYRSTQRIIDYCRLLRPDSPVTQSLVKYGSESGTISFENQSVSTGDLPDAVAGYINAALQRGIPPGEICVLAPQWAHLRVISRALVARLPDVEFDAPGLSPIYGQRDNIWYEIARVLLSAPAPNRFGTRIRWANGILGRLSEQYNVRIPEELQNARKLLRFANSVSRDEHDGLAFLRFAFSSFLDKIEFEIEACPALQHAHTLFFEKANDALERIGEDAARSLESFQGLFGVRSGVRISTCHGAKGEEYATVIAFGFLRGYIPNWSEIYKDQAVAEEHASRLIYVVCSRAKLNLHLIAESGRRTKGGSPYETTSLLLNTNFRYD